jgi:hypothetical protein
MDAPEVAVDEGIPGLVLDGRLRVARSQISSHSSSDGPESDRPGYQK